MRLVVTILLIVTVFILGLRVYVLQHDLVQSRERAISYGKRNEALQNELLRMGRAYAQHKQSVREIEENIRELESKISLEAIERYLPKKTWDEIKPIIDRLKAFDSNPESKE